MEEYVAENLHDARPQEKDDVARVDKASRSVVE